MSVTYLGVGKGVRRASNNKGIRTYIRELLFSSNDPDDDEVAVGNQPEVPPLGSIHPSDNFAYLQSIEVDNFAPYAGWKVTLTYSTERELSEEPTQDPALTEWDGELYQRPLVIDKDGDAVCNSAGDPFDPPVMRDDSRLVSTTVKNMTAVPTWIMSYADAVNSDAFTLDGFPVGVGQAKMQRPRVSKPMIRNNIQYREVTFVIQYREGGWLSEPLDIGFRKLDGSNRVNITDSNGDFVTAPVPLDGSGDVLADPSPTNNVTLSFTQYTTLPFSILPLT